MIRSQFHSLPVVMNGTDTMSASIAAILSYYAVNIGFKHNFSDAPVPCGLGAQLGFAIGLAKHKEFEITETKNSLTARSIRAINSAMGIRLSMRPELLYDFPLTQDFLFTPLVGYDYPITKVDNTS